MDAFKKDRLGRDGTWIDFCRHYGGDCGSCFPRNGDGEHLICFQPLKECTGDYGKKKKAKLLK